MTQLECEPRPPKCSPTLPVQLGQNVSAIEGTGSATKQWSGVVVEVDYHTEVFIICCANVPNYPHGCNMAVPFSEASSRINQKLHAGKRKRKRKKFYE